MKFVRRFYEVWVVSGGPNHLFMKEPILNVHPNVTIISPQYY